MGNQNELPIQGEAVPALEHELDAMLSFAKDPEDGRLVDLLNKVSNSLSDFQIGDKDEVMKKLKMITYEVENNGSQKGFNTVVRSLVENIEDKLGGRGM